MLLCSKGRGGKYLPMKSLKPTDILTAILIVLFLTGYYFLTKYILSYSSTHFNYLPVYIWKIVWTFLLTILFSIDYIKILIKPGKLKINFVYLILALLMLTLFIPRTPLFYFFYISPGIELLFLVFWYSLIRTFYKTADS